MKAFAWPVKFAIWGLASALSWVPFAQENNTKSPEKQPPPPKVENLPSAKTILRKYMEAIGGEEAFRKHDSQHAVGTVSMPGQQLEGKMEVFAARPNKLLVIIEMPGIGEITTGFNGDAGWMSNPLTGPMLLPEAMMDQLATQADFDHALHRPEDYTTAETLGVEEFGGESCYKLRLVHRTGFESTEFFSRESGLQRGFIAVQASPFGEVNVTTIVTDYKQFGDVKLPSKTIQKVSGMEQTMTIDEMEFDTVPASKFDLPPAIKTLTEKEGDSPEK